MRSNRNVGITVIFIYLRDGRRIDVESATTFVHRGEQIVCLDSEGNETQRFDSREVTAYGHVPYPYDPDFVSRPLSPEERQPWPPHRRYRRRRQEEGHMRMADNR
jgi:hypothetical protein